MEMVKHPKHYNLHPAGIECITVIEEMPANIAFAMKHLWRVGLKPGQDDIQDLEKAIEYVRFEIARKKRAKAKAVAAKPKVTREAASRPRRLATKTGRRSAERLGYRV